MGAYYDDVFPQLATWLHPDIFGTAKGKEAAEIAWDAQA